MFRFAFVLALTLTIVLADPFPGRVQAAAGVTTGDAMADSLAGLRFAFDPYLTRLMNIVWICFGMLTLLAMCVSFSDTRSSDKPRQPRETPDTQEKRPAPDSVRVAPRSRLRCSVRRLS